MVQAVILAGGKGTRISSLFPELPKALVPINGKPFLQWQLEWLRRGGITRVHFALGYRAEAIRNWLDESGGEGLSFSFTEEPEPLGTGGCLRFAREAIESDPFLVVNGDTLLPRLDARAQSAAYGGRGVDILLSVTEVENAGRYGSMRVDGADRVTDFTGKGNQGRGIINGGYYLVARKVLEEIPGDRFCSMEEEILTRLARERRIGVFRCPGPLLDMGTPDGLAELEAFLGVDLD